MQQRALDPAADAVESLGRRLGCGHGGMEGTRAREHVELPVDHPDARGRPRHPLQDLGDLGDGARVRRRPRSRRRTGAVGGALDGERLERYRREVEESRAIVERGRDRLRGARELLLLRVAQHAFELAHVAPAEERDREEHGQHEEELRADAEREQALTYVAASAPGLGHGSPGSRPPSIARRRARRASSSPRPPHRRTFSLWRVGRPPRALGDAPCGPGLRPPRARVPLIRSIDSPFRTRCRCDRTPDRRRRTSSGSASRAR